MDPESPELRVGEVGVLIVDHGSRRSESNAMLLDVVAMFQRSAGYEIVEPAHMELAEPSIQTAFDRCVERGAKLVVVHPFFLLPGRHWHQDIPSLAKAAAERHPGIRFLVTAPLGLDPMMGQMIHRRIEQCLQQALGRGDACDLCDGTDGCEIRESD